MALSLGIKVEVAKESLHHLVDILATVGPLRVALPMNEAFMNPIKALWHTPSCLPLTSKRAKHKYYVPSQGFDYLYCLAHNLPCFHSWALWWCQWTMKWNKEQPQNQKMQKTLDLFGRKVYYTGGLQLRIANQQVLFGLV